MKKILSLLVLILMLLPSVSLSQSNRNKLNPRTVHGIREGRWARLATQMEVFLVVSKPLTKYLSNLFKTDFNNVSNATAIIKQLMPTTVAYTEERLLKKYGVDISRMFIAEDIKRRKQGGVIPKPPTLPPELVPLGPALAWAAATVAIYWGIDEIAERCIVQDLQQSGFTHDEAIAAAEHITAEGSEAAGEFLDNLGPDPITPRPPDDSGRFENLAKFINFIEAIRDAKDYDPAAYNPDEDWIPDDMMPGGGGRGRALFGDAFGRSYMEWAANRGNGNSDGCPGWEYVPATSILINSYDANGNLVTTVIDVPPTWRCIR